MAIAGWWYGRNLWITGTFSGLSESVMLRDTGPGAMLRAAIELPWLRAVDAILMSHRGYATVEVMSERYQQAMENILNYLDGKPLPLINPDVQGRTSR